MMILSFQIVQGSNGNYVSSEEEQADVLANSVFNEMYPMSGLWVLADFEEGRGAPVFDGLWSGNIDDRLKLVFLHMLDLCACFYMVMLCRD